MNLLGRIVKLPGTIPTEVVFDMMHETILVYRHKAVRSFPVDVCNIPNSPVTDIDTYRKQQPVGKANIFHAVKDNDLWILQCKIRVDIEVPYLQALSIKEIIYSFVDNVRGDPSHGRAFHRIDRVIVETK